MNKIALFTCLTLLFFACSPGPRVSKIETEKVKPDKNIIWEAGPPIYNESRKREFDLIHTRLDVRPDFEKEQLKGYAHLTLKPYFYPGNRLELDAKGMEIFEVALQGQDGQKDLDFEYANDILSITLDKTYLRTDTFKIAIHYLSKPNERPTGGSAAITSDKGLYFINAKGDDENKPVQVWTQGETESNSVWFPTIDSPNERMSQELFITVPDNYVTLSNGNLIFSTENGDGSRTDYWKQDLPHAPYLTMMAIGEYAIVKDQWRDKDVHYYIEETFEPYARDIFGNTPEMIEFYSRLLGVDYPWDKYHQVIVRDYVSGAMENTGAVIFGEFMNKTSRELLDGDNESIIAHELFHHWFGDLVTCESWANLPLNESFATYGEYLWIEHKYGKDAADHHLKGNLAQYLMEAQRKQVDLVRFDYRDKEEMFDHHSYAKGGRVLHMLRKYVGDEAFFESLKLYLETHKFSSVEIHDLRLAFEKVTGEDLNWFFNQWFLSSGHPELIIRTGYDQESNKAFAEIEQVQDLAKTPLYKLPMDIDIYAGGIKQRHRVLVINQKEVFHFESATKPDLINVDAEKMLLCVKQEEKDNMEWAFQFKNAPLYIDRLEALEQLSEKGQSPGNEVFFSALADPHYTIRLAAIKNAKALVHDNGERLKTELLALASRDPKSQVRARAIKELVTLYKGDEGAVKTYQNATRDSSYLVVGEALAALLKEDEQEALKQASLLEQEKNIHVLVAIAAIYAQAGNDSHNEFFIRSAKNFTGYSKYTFIGAYGDFLRKRSDEAIGEGLPLLEEIAESSTAWWMRMGVVQVLLGLEQDYKEKINMYQDKIKQPAGEEDEVIQAKMAAAESNHGKIRQLLSSIKANESNEQLLKLLQDF